MSSRPPIVIDGSQGEGGGQILRNASAYAAILGIDLSIHNIRAGRTKPGLQAQHLTGLNLVAALSGGVLQGAERGSQTIHYRPSPANSTPLGERTFYGLIETAGSICLLLQAALPVALLSRPALTRLELEGGTNATMAPQYDYWANVFLPILESQSGIPPVEAIVRSRGYFPRGGGQVHVTVQPFTTPLRPIHLLERGNITSIHIRSFHAGRLPRHVAEDLAQAAEKQLRSSSLLAHVQDWTADVVTEPQAMGSGAGVLIVATTSTGCRLAGSALVAPKRRAREIGQAAADELLATLDDGGCVDEWLQDQLILYMALAEGESQLLTGSLTLHTQTAINIAEQLCGVQFQVDRLTNAPVNEGKGYGKDGRIPGQHLVRCTGLGLVPARAAIDSRSNS